ncbi:MAG: tRNA (adenosine(37)-N6)-threonylcarbamoyltransferase complex dimerization subunit type 1 TsaB [Lachnospiraceae bacterium]|nr:tRNA (adenosine(37)-N6)-threonylcarbamoyltransferase complex dimerization subunit type 1 TsaB [Lachnospiraceae bacterium]
MKLLVLDSSGLVASVAVMEDDSLIGEYTINHKKTHSQTLLPMLDEVVKMTETDLNEMDAIALAKGPGSFTGLRIGSATAKGLGLALDKPIVAVPTVDAIAYNLYHTEGYICPIIDARRNNVYTGIYAWNENEFEVIQEQCSKNIEEIIDEVNAFESPVIFLGDGVDVHRERILEKCSVPVSFAPAHLSRQRAGAVGSLAMEYYKQGKIESAAEHGPEYLKKSQAEREREQKKNAN